MYLDKDILSYLSNEYFCLFRIDRDKAIINDEISDLRVAVDEVNRSKAATEKQNKHLTNSLNDINKKVDSMNLSLSDMELSKRKLEAENADLLHQLHELQIGANMLNTANQNLREALDEQNQVCADEGRGRSSLLSKYRNLEHEFESLRHQLEDEMVSKEHALLNRCL